MARPDPRPRRRAVRRPRRCAPVGVRGAGCSASAPLRALGVRAAGHRSPCRVAGRDWAMRKGSREACGALSSAPCRRACVFRSTCRAIARTALDRPRFPRPIRRSSRTAPDRPRFPRLIRGSSASTRARVGANLLTSSLIAQSRPEARAESGARRRGRRARQAAPTRPHRRRPRAAGFVRQLSTPRVRVQTVISVRRTTSGSSGRAPVSVSSR
jgi:hypothetical protein